MIKFNVADIKKKLMAETSFQMDAQPGELNISSEDLPVIGKISIEGNIENAGDVLLMRAHLKTRVKRVCSRCLKEFEAQTEAEVEERYFPAETDGLSEDALTYKFDVVDITEALREGLILTEPVQPLCKASCKGLCPICGADRNVVDCHCNTRTIDPRLQKLAELLHK